MQDDAALIALVAVFGLPVAGWVAVRMMEHVERMEMIRRGMLPPPGGESRPAVAPPALDVCLQVYLGVRLFLAAIALLLGLSFVVYPGGVFQPEAHGSQPGGWILLATGVWLLVAFGRRPRAPAKAAPPSRGGFSMALPGTAERAREKSSETPERL
jgi:hypothetical protein